MNAEFPTDLDAIYARLNSLDPQKYASSRNFLDGAVTRLSPYLTHGALSLPQVRDVAYERTGKRGAYKLVFELAWREYFQRVWWEKGDDIFSDLKRPQENIHAQNVIPEAILHASTGIDSIDASIRELLETGWVHNHARMWTAMLTVNVGQVHWAAPARWYYYHLLDGDLASNCLSWQWVAGTFSAKKYVANQENLNKYDETNRQYKTFLDRPYELLLEPPIPKILEPTRTVDLTTTLPAGSAVKIRAGARVLLYHPWSLSADWHKEENWQRILVLEPSHFARFPMSAKRIDFILGLAKNIPELQLFVGEVSELSGLSDASEVRFRAHPAARHFPGVMETPQWLFPALPLQNTPGSFMNFWKSAERLL